ncbi:hypothetical protein [Idiomarina loihiensis]|uniref:hypothetical protein n=1 Tax=Idiomarina loihiensis TaxID=135577 RepID=UPI003158A4C2
MDKAAYGLIGVALGFLLTILKDWWFQRKRNRKEIEYLCIHVTCMLDRFVSGCCDVVYDDGLYHGQPDQDGYSRIQVRPPQFKPENLDVEWKSLPSTVMYKVLNFPQKIEQANSTIDANFEHANPPDYLEGFEERQLQYANLGLRANQLTTELRVLGKLPVEEKGDWDPIEHMEDQKAKIEQLREKRYKAQEKMFGELSARSEK